MGVLIVVMTVLVGLLVVISASPDLPPCEVVDHVAELVVDPVAAALVLAGNHLI